MAERATDVGEVKLKRPTYTDWADPVHQTLIPLCNLSTEISKIDEKAQGVQRELDARCKKWMSLAACVRMVSAGRIISGTMSRRWIRCCQSPTELIAGARVGGTGRWTDDGKRVPEARYGRNDDHPLGMVVVEIQHIPENSGLSGKFPQTSEFPSYSIPTQCISQEWCNFGNRQPVNVSGRILSGENYNRGVITPILPPAPASFIAGNLLKDARWTLLNDSRILWMGDGVGRKGSGDAETTFTEAAGGFVAGRWKWHVLAWQGGSPRQPREKALGQEYTVYQ
ncbi:hypothetical protein C8R44DRAFT_734740 [Mycena epipterygia]|nr:hypothetical protein C8R44DRAFT_734740 [Mycena epipterygia]